MKNWGIQTRILLLALAPAVAVAGALSVYFVLALLADLDRDLQERGLGLTRQLAAIAEYSTYSGDRQSLNSVALAALEESNVTRVEIYDQDGEPLAASGALPPSLSLRPDSQQV
ncbi:MAG TPA: hybrid sensor histidine kinase/response regulator, partial [Azospira sp.]|nr:hybrid sensor histidine kinase/response regulator [Azospira sp.]